MKAGRRAIMAVLLIAVACAVVFSAGMVGYLRHDTRRYADQAIALLRPYAGISYSHVSVSLSGSVGIDGIRIRWQQGEEIRIGSIQLHVFRHFSAVGNQAGTANRPIASLGIGV